jgi:hypothetical protein
MEMSTTAFGRRFFQGRWLWQLFVNLLLDLPRIRFDLLLSIFPEVASLQNDGGDNREENDENNSVHLLYLL